MQENWRKRRKFYAWGGEDEGATAEEAHTIERVWGDALGADSFEATPPPTLDEISLEPPRIGAVPPSLQPICHTDPYHRALHTYGKSFMESARCFARDFADAPDAVVYPRNEAEVAAVLDWCGGAEQAAIPFGGGSSAVYGINPVVGEHFESTVSIDMSHMNRVLEADTTSRAARVQAGVFGPDLDAQLISAGIQNAAGAAKLARRRGADPHHVRADRLQIIHFIKGRDLIDTDQRHVENFADMFQGHTGQPAVALALRQIQQR